MRILHIITGLGDGGAEAMLFKLIKHSKNNENLVISLTDSGKYGKKLDEINVKYFTLDMKKGSFSFIPIIKLFRLIKNIKPDVVQTWMYHANLIGGLVSKLLKIKKIYWNIRSSDLNFKNLTFINKLVFYLGGIFSHIIPNKIITCSNAAFNFHIKKGYKNIFFYIPNGFDNNIFFKVNESLINKKKIEWINDQNKFIYGIIARYHPQKNHSFIFKSINTHQ